MAIEQPRITYTIAMPRPHTHLFHLTLDVTAVNSDQTILRLPTWTPGSYLIREFARHLQAFAAFDAANGQPLAWSKTAKDTWQVATPDVDRLRVTYQVYAHDLSVRTSHLDGSHGYFNGANVFLYLPERTHEPLLLHVVPPVGQGWRVTTGLEPYRNATSASTSEDTLFIARDYDELLDCPVECGLHRLLTFTVADKEHRIAIWGQGNEDEQRLVDDTKRIVETHYALFGDLPYQHYTFILHLAERYGGLEHRNSVTNIIDRWSFQIQRSYERFLELQSHEFFHVWNVKRIRPETLGPFDYQQENYSHLLWAMEGVTSYYDRLLLVRAGLMTPARYLELLADEIVRLQSQPGRFLDSLEDSSFDAWIKFYRRDENSENSSVSYYLKGGLVILLLDLTIRQQTDGRCSFDDVLRYLYRTYPLDGPGIPEDGGYLAAIEAAVGVAAGTDHTYRDFFTRYVSGTEELAYADILGYVGVQLKWGYTLPTHGDIPPPWLGAKLKQDGGRTQITSTRSDGPAAVAGIYPGDELLALDGWRIDAESLPQRLIAYRPGDTVTLSLFRRDELLHVPLQLAPAPYDKLKLTRVNKPTPQQERLYQNWLATKGAS